MTHNQRIRSMPLSHRTCRVCISLVVFMPIVPIFAADGANEQGVAPDRHIAPRTTERWEIEHDLADDQSVALSFLIRADGVGGGFHHDLRIYVNNVPVNGFVNRQTCRILNKDSFRFKYPRYGYYAWCNTDEGWAVIRAPSFEGGRVNVYGADLYRYVLDITDLVREGANTVRFENRLKDTDKDPSLVVRDLAVMKRDPLKSQDAPPAHDLPVGAAWAVSVRPDGSLRLRADDVTLTLASQFTNVGKAMRCSAQAGTVEHAPVSYQWENDALTIQRTLHRDGHWLVIEDTMRARQSEIGNISRYEIQPGNGPFPHARVCGFPYPEVVASDEAGNPTVFGSCNASANAAGIGMAAETTVLRMHANYTYDRDAGSLAIVDDRLVVSNEREYTARLVVFLPARNDYWGFITALRRRWNMPVVTSPLYIPSIYPDSFDHMSDDQLRQYIDRSGVQSVITGTGIDLPDRPRERSILGLGLGREPVVQRRAGWRKLRDRLKRVTPNVRFMLKVHSYFNTPTLPDDHERYADAAMTTATGEKVRHGYYGHVFVPTLNNTFGRDWHAMLNRIADETGADGFYWDEFTRPGLPDDLDVSYSTWDGYTADLDDDGRIVRKAAHVPLITLPFRMAVVREQLDKGRTWCLGGEPRSAEEQILSANWWRECQNHPYYAFAGHLCQAQAYVSSSADLAFYRDVIACGALPCRTRVGVMNRFLEEAFPFTLESLGDGWLRGRNKLITTRSGMFTWSPDITQVRVLTFHGSGGEHETIAPVNDQGALQVDVPNGAIVMVKSLNREKQ